MSRSSTGIALSSVTSGTGRGGFFSIANAASSGLGLESVTIGTGGAGLFTINNNASPMRPSL